ncbi:MAG: hypothetical protein KJ587_01785 [Alphaproteobacteria bacterium]|nr:hypothetical protein [Alphaproteobacteria bacterium]
MLDVIYKMIDVEKDVFTIIVVVCVIAAVLKRELLGSDLLAIISVPVYIFASLAGLYIFRYNYLVVVADHQIEAVIAAALGITVSFLVFLVLMDFVRLVTGWNVKRIIKNRKLDGGAR